MQGNVPAEMVTEPAAFDAASILAGAQDEIRAHVTAAMKEAVIGRLKWSLANEVDSIIAAYVRDELAPAVKAELSTHHAEMVRAAVEAVVLTSKDMGDKLREALLAKLTKSFADTWKVDRLIKEVIG